MSEASDAEVVDIRRERDELLAAVDELKAKLEREKASAGICGRRIMHS